MVRGDVCLILALSALVLAGCILSSNDLANPDFMLFARSFGVSGIRVRSCAALAEALQTARRVALPTLIEVFLPEFKA